MLTRRVIYVISLAGLVAFYALYPFWISQYFVIVMLLLIPLDLLVSMPGVLTRRISLSAPPVLDIGSSGTLFLTTHLRKPFPSGRIKARLITIGDDFTTRRKIICDPEDGSRHSIAIDTSHCGVTVFKIKRLNTSSVIGLFSPAVSVDCMATSMILPAPKKPKHIVSLPRGVILAPKPGGGFSENIDLRPYRKGDPVRSIHWKLSAKYDSIIIREPLVPPRHSRLVRFVKWSGARERDIIVGRLRWVSDYLLKWDLPYFIRLGDDGPTAEIACEKDFMDYIFGVMGNKEHSFPALSSLPSRFSWVLHIDAKEGAEE